MNKKVELLSPAGSFEAFKMAIMGGADAVYFAGSKFGARAYAQNLTNEEIIRAIQIANTLGKKTYLTVNTLLKTDELDSLNAYLLPFYMEGLNAIIVQDFGVMTHVQENFPKLEIHASTQMAITGSYGALFLKNLGVKRIVAARELSLTEISAIKKKTEMEIECFVHGAMCYSYSGSCLFSSILGGRSGNRGRCAQPCRLPYAIDHSGNTVFPLSMKDMNSIPLLNELIDGNIDSFKIEGRMKKAEYVAAVTKIYRKYIDKNEKAKINEINIELENQDEKLLNMLYVRSGTQTGYYHLQNGKEMITIHNSAYKETSEEVLDSIKAEFNSKEMPCILVEGLVTVFADANITLQMEYKGENYYYEGDLVERAENKPLLEANIYAHINKTNGRLFAFKNLTIYTDNASFLPVSSLNNLRRVAFSKMEEILFSKYQRKAPEIIEKNSIPIRKQRIDKTKISVQINTMEQFYHAFSNGVDRIYIPIDLYGDHIEEITDWMRKKESKIEIDLALPYVLREKDHGSIISWKELIEGDLVSGVLIKNLEEVGLLETYHISKRKTLDNFIYCFNRESEAFWMQKGYECTASFELNQREWSSLSNEKSEYVVYGYIPLMLSANCIAKTTGKCPEKEELVHTLSDRKNKDFFATHNCKYCFSILYNSVPLSTHKYIDQIQSTFSRLRLDFTIETVDEMDAVLKGYLKSEFSFESGFPITENNYTNGHIKRGVE